MSLQVDVFSGSTWAEEVAARLATRVHDEPRLRLCLPTGNTPRPAYRALARRHRVLASTEVFLLDEFVLPAEHPARCDSMLQRDLLALLDAPPAVVHAINVGAQDREAECDRYETLIAARGMDLTLLGLGGNGHVGLNEPGSDQTSRTRFVRLADETVRSAAAYGEGEPPRWGATMGLATILDSAEIWLLVTGAHKAEILNRVHNGPVGPEVPASYLRNHGNVLALVDEEAAQTLDGAPEVESPRTEAAGG